MQATANARTPPSGGARPQTLRCKIRAAASAAAEQTGGEIALGVMRKTQDETELCIIETVYIYHFVHRSEGAGLQRTAPSLRNMSEPL